VGTLVGFFLLVAVWLTILTNKNKKQSAKIEKLENQLKTDTIVIEYLKMLLYGKEENKKTETGEEEGS